MSKKNHITSRIASLSLACLAPFLIASCVGPAASELRAEIEPIKLSSTKQPVEILDCIVPSWESILMKNFVYTRPTAEGYRVDKTSDLGHLYASLDIKSTTDNTEVLLWVIHRNIWGEGQRQKVRDTVLECL